MKDTKSRALSRKKDLEDDEREAIRKYGIAIKHSEGRNKKVYKHILPQEKHHLRELK